MDQFAKLPYSSIIGALEYQAEVRPDKKAILYPDPTKNSSEYGYLTYRQYNNVLNDLSFKISKYLSKAESNTCALLSVGGLEYLLSQYALLKLPNVIMFPISARNSESAIEHLLRETKTILLLTTSQYLPMIRKIKEKEEFQSLKILLLDSDEFKTEELLKNKDIQSSQISNIIPIRTKSVEEFNKVVLILHSSGSTAHPKPIRITNRYFLLINSIYTSINKDFYSENDVILSWGALFHLLTFSPTVRSIMVGCTYALPLCVTFPPKPDELLRNIQVENDLTVLITVPSLLEQLIRELLLQKNSHIGLKPLQKLRFITYGGAGCPDELCKTLVDNGIILLSVYGATEAGTILINNPDPYDKRWKVMEFPDVRKAYVRFESPPDAQNINEKILIHLPNDPFLAENISNRPDGCYTVGDILLEDPPSSGRYSVLGRHDDTLVHINGEKTNPLPIEDIIRRSQFVEQVAIVGQNQFCPMALIQLNISESFNYTFKEIEDNISNYVELANKQSPSHSHILKELIYILPMKDILPRTEKGNLMRQKVNQEYSHLINQIYQEFFNKKEKKKEKNIYWTKQNIEKYLQDKLNLNQIKDLDYSKSIFQYGINSLQIIQLTNFICQDICEIEKDFLYEYSSIQQITEELIKYLNYQKEEQKEDNDPFHYQLTEQIIEKYIHLIKQNSNLINKRKLNEITERTFLITGANGSLANFIILHLLKQPKSIVKRIYCLLRGSDIKERFFQSFIQKKFDISILIKSFEEKRIILCQSMNLPDEYLGQTNEFYQELKDQLTDIIHLAWKINFNQTIKDFEYDSILGLYNLLKLSSFNSIQFHFISSISSAASGFLTNIKEKPLPRNSQIPLIQGYGQSKYAAEHISWAAMDLWNIPVNIYRVGQISGDTINGVWNKNEMAAMMIYAGAGQLKKMPNIGDDINWIPIDICSAAILDFILKSSFDISIKSDQRVYHILNPNSITYQQYLIYLKQAGLNFDIISNEEFIENILITNDQTNPLIKLSSFIQQRFLNKHLSKKSIFQTIKTVQQSQILQNCPQIDSNLIKLYLNYWKNIQLFEQIP